MSRLQSSAKQRAAGTALLNAMGVGDTIEIDTDAQISDAGAEGWWIQCWLWLAADDDEEHDNNDDDNEEA